MRFAGFDIETDGQEEGFALQPWRLKEGKALITLSAAFFQGKRKVEGEFHSALVEDLRKLKKPVALYNGIFDLAWLYAADIDISGVRWMDAMLLWKWLENGQSGPMRWTLKDAAKKFLKDWPRQEEFLALKSEELPDASDPYWLTRVTLDAEATALIAGIIWPQLTPQQQRLAQIQSLSLPTIAASWVNGVHVDIDRIKFARPGIIKEMLGLETELGLQELTEPGIYRPSKILRSPTKMRTLLYTDYGLTCTRFTEKKAQSTDKAALTYLADIDDRCITILKWRELNTILSKFIEGPIACCDYLGSSVTHAAPKVFSTYTGRMTYSSKSKKNRIGIPLHQTPRKKEIRSYIVAPPGYYIFEADASGQEMRGMAALSQDPEMLQLFNSPPPYDDGHSLMGARIGDIPFEEFLQRKKAKDPIVVGGDGLRAAGKFCIAEGQLVDTDSGPIPIEHVSLGNKVWDGLDFVTHDGVVYNGFQDVILREGLLATPDHKVMDQNGVWVAMRDIGNIKSIHPPNYEDHTKQFAPVYDILNSGPRHRFTIQGKIVSNCNLSMAYRSGPATSRRVARVQYGLDVEIKDVVAWKKAYTDLFKGVETYWKDAPKLARAQGYAETPAGRRYGLTRWHDLQWGTSSSAINFPIQGMGADQRDVAIAVTVLTYPELWDKFYLDLHDGMYFLVKKTARLSYLQRIMHTLDTIDYQKYWGVELPVPYVWEGSFGPDWGHKIGIPTEQDEDPTLEQVYIKSITE